MRGRRQAYLNLVIGSNRHKGLWKTLDGGWLGPSFCRGRVVNLALLEMFIGEGEAMGRDG